MTGRPASQTCCWSEPDRENHLWFPVGSLSRGYFLLQIGVFFEIRLDLLIWPSWDRTLLLAVLSEAIPRRIHGRVNTVTHRWLQFSPDESLYIIFFCPSNKHLLSAVIINPSKRACDVHVMSGSPRTWGIRARSLSLTGTIPLTAEKRRFCMWVSGRAHVKLSLNGITVHACVLDGGSTLWRILLARGVARWRWVMKLMARIYLLMFVGVPVRVNAVRMHGCKIHKVSVSEWLFFFLPGFLWLCVISSGSLRPLLSKAPLHGHLDLWGAGRHVLCSTWQVLVPPGSSWRPQPDPMCPHRPSAFFASISTFNTWSNIFSLPHEAPGALYMKNAV